MAPSSCLAIVGATCTGKSGLALALAQSLGAELVNGDALQVYRGLNRGTAKPNEEERALVPHHLIDILDPEERFSAGEFSRRARRLIAEVQGRGRLPIVVGGSGFYIRALFRGLSAIPAVPEEVRESLRNKLEERGLEALYRELERVDPATARRLSPQDKQRILRALEVAAATGRAISEWRSVQPAEKGPEALLVGLTLPRPLLYDRIALRARCMVRRGWVNEIEGLLAQGVSEAAPAFQAIGYRQLLSHLRGHCALEDAIEETVRATRRYAKRQETWFRRERVSAWFPSTDPGLLASNVMTYLASQGIRS